MRKANEVWVLRHVRKAKRTPLAEENAEDAVANGQLADLSSRLLVNSGREEALHV